MGNEMSMNASFTVEIWKKNHEQVSAVKHISIFSLNKHNYAPFLLQIFSNSRRCRKITLLFSSLAPHLFLDFLQGYSLHSGICFVNHPELRHFIVNACNKQLVFELVLEVLIGCFSKHPPLTVGIKVRNVLWMKESGDLILVILTSGQ